jgi:hypothetical protein
MADKFESLYEAIKQSNETYAAAISALSQAIQNLPTEAPSSDRERVADNVVRLARMSKNAVVAAIEQGFDLWERQVRRISTASTETASSPPVTGESNPIEAWAENWRKAAQAFTTAGGNEELRKRAEAVQNAFVEGIRAWQRLWEPERR